MRSERPLELIRLSSVLTNGGPRALFKLLTLSLLFSLLVVSPAFALSLQDAKSAGLVGELKTGYLGAVQSQPSAEVKALVDEINKKRRAHYQSIAEKNGTAITAVEKLAAEKAIQLTAPGQYVNIGSGWTKK